MRRMPAAARMISSRANGVGLRSSGSNRVASKPGCPYSSNAAAPWISKRGLAVSRYRCATVARLSSSPRRASATMHLPARNTSSDSRPRRSAGTASRISRRPISSAAW